MDADTGLRARNKHFLYQHAPCGPGPALTRLRGQQTPDKSAKHSGACPGTRCPSPPRAARRHHLLRQRWAMMLSRPASSSSAAGSQPIHRHIDRAELRRRERGPGSPFQLAEGRLGSPRTPQSMREKKPRKTRTVGKPARQFSGAPSLPLSLPVPLGYL